MNRRKKRVVFGIGLAVALVLIGVSAHYLISVYNGLNGLKKSKELSPFQPLIPLETSSPEPPPEWTGKEPVNILLMGVDARGFGKGEIPRSDTLMVFSLDPVHKRTQLFSILRDTYTEIPGYGKKRINTAVTHGPNTAMEAVSDLLGVPIHYYVYTDFQGFIKLVDAVGGVDFHVEKDMYYPSAADNHEYDIDLKQGEQHLDGDKALQYVRFRHDATSDYTRTERQREFLKALSEKLKSTTSIMKLPSILEEISPYVDTNFSVNDMWKLASLGYKSSMGESVQIPPMNLVQETYVGKAAVLTVSNGNELKAYVQGILNKPDPEPTTQSSSPDEP